MLHFKFLSSFPENAVSEATRGQHAMQAAEYHYYANALASESNLSLYDPAHSLRFQDSEQLIALGIMQRQSDPERQQRQEAQLIMKNKQIQAYVELAESRYLKGDLSQACAYYSRIIELDPTFLPAYHRLAYLMQENGWADRALSVLNQASLCNSTCNST